MLDASRAGDVLPNGKTPQAAVNNIFQITATVPSTNLDFQEWTNLWREANHRYVYIIAKVEDLDYALPALNPPLNISQHMEVYLTEAYDQDYVADDSNSVCVTMTNRYYWGFSAWALIFTASFHGLWCMLLLALHVHNRRRSTLCQHSGYLRELKATLDLGTMMASEIEDVQQLSAKELEKAMANHKLSYVTQAKTG